jgi:hypothetical protein
VPGGYGYTRDFPVERYMREAKVMQISEGTKQIQRLVIGRQLDRNRPRRSTSAAEGSHHADHVNVQLAGGAGSTT